MSTPVPGTGLAGNVPGIYSGIVPSNGSSILGGYGINSPRLVGGVFGSASKNAQSTDPVWVGNRALGQGSISGGHDRGRRGGSIAYDQAQNLPARWYTDDQKFYKEFISKAILYKLPGASTDMGLPEAGAVWDNLLQTAIQLNKANPDGKNWTPWDVLESYNRKPGSLGTRKVGDWLIDNATGEKVKYVGPKTKTTKQTAIDLSNPEDVQAIATQVLTQMIGRAPTDKELAQFKSSLNSYEQSHPEITTTTDTYDDMGNVSASNVVRSGGVDDAARSVLLSEGVKETKEYGKYQGGTNYFNALLQMIGGS